MSGGSKLTIEHLRTNGGRCIRLKGVIDETFDKEAFVADADGVVIVDLDEVTRITSYGVREWMTALQRLRHSWLGFVNCRPPIVAQFNMVAGFGGRGHVLTLYLPYVCPTSGKAFEVKVDLRRHYGEIASFRPPATQCPDSAAQAEFDDVPEAYLSYVASQPAPVPPPLVERLLSDALEPTSSFRVRKDVLGDVTGLWLSGRLDERDHFKRIADGLEGTLYVSFSDVLFGSEEGVARLMSFLRGVTVPFVLGDFPLGLAERIAADPALANATVVSMTLPAICVNHDVVTVTVAATRVADAMRGAPMLLFCPHCEIIAKPTFDGAALRSLATLHFVPTTPGVAAVIEAHQRSSSEAAQTTLPSGERPSLTERFQIIRPLGAGGMAEVFLARQLGEGGFERAVVLKRILPGLATDAAFVEMFLQEAQLASRLSHPNVVQIFDVGRVAGQYFMVMELVSGWDLHTVLRASQKLQRPFPLHLAARITADIARGLSAAHSYTDAAGKPSPIIHRDVSPHNVLVSNQGHVKLTDFGIAKAADSLSRTPTSLVKGKTAYLAPEMVTESRGPLDGRVDLFAAGLIFYQLLTLRHPFKRDSELATFQALIHDTPAAPSTLAPGLGASVDQVVSQALAKDPARRYSTAGQFERDLESLIMHSAGSVAANDVATWIMGIPELVPMRPIADSPSGATPTKRG